VRRKEEEKTRERVGECSVFLTLENTKYKKCFTDVAAFALKC